MALRGTTADISSAFALDANALTGLRQQARTSPELALSKAAGQFEALFVSMVLKSMRDALPQDGPFSSETTKTYTAMFDQQLAQKLSERGIGLRKALEQQLARSLPGAKAAQATPETGAAAPALTSTPTTSTAPSRLRSLLPTAAPAVTTPANGTAPASTSSLPAAVTAFIDKLRPQAEAAAKALGVPVQFLLAQAGLESGWGKSQPKTTDGVTSHNLFGIKAGRSWSGGVAPARTTEYVQGSAIKSTERFRAYGSYSESFQDFVKLLKDNQRYANTLASTHSARDYAQSLQRAGYATDPAYADKLMRAIALVNRHDGAPATQVLAGAADTIRDRA